MTTSGPPPAALASETEARVRASIARQTMLTTLGVTIERLEPGYVELGLGHRPDLSQQHGFVHAAAITAIADSACGYAAYTLVPSDRDVLTVDFSLNLVAPAASRASSPRAASSGPGEPSARAAARSTGSRTAGNARWSR